MKNYFYLLIVLFILSPVFHQAQDYKADSTIIRKIFDEALTNGESYENLRELALGVGNRLSGSPEAEKAVKWAEEKMNATGLDKVWLQECMVPHWVRGEKEVVVLSSKDLDLEIHIPSCALGSSVGTGPEGIKTGIIAVKDFEELKALGKDKINGKIVFFSRPMDHTHINTFYAYSGAVDQRVHGAEHASEYGAVAVLVRSMSLKEDDFPHTGNMKYGDASEKIPALAISTKGATQLSAVLNKDPEAQVFVRTTCENLPEVMSYNVIGEIKGTEKPEEIIIVGGHLDSWDLGDGAHDDGSGCVQSLEVLRIFNALNIKPKRTIRVVFYMNEENGLRGGKAYAEWAKGTSEKHIAAIESDAGGFTPRGFGIRGSNKQVEFVQQWENLLSPYGLHDIIKGYGGADISTLKDFGTALIGYIPDTQRYFDFHHAASDTFDKINKRELEMGAGSMAALAWLISEYGMIVEEGEVDLPPVIPTSK